MKYHQAVEVGGSVRVKLNTGEELPLSTKAKRERDLWVMLTQRLFYLRCFYLIVLQQAATQAVMSKQYPQYMFLNKELPPYHPHSNLHL